MTSNFIMFGDYRVFDDGSIISCKYNKMREVVQHLNKSSGYKYCKLYVNKRGYTYLCHGLIMKLFVGEPPLGFTVDHINRDKLDNRLSNLRYADRTEQIINQKMRCDNTSGFKGVSFSNKDCKWVASMTKKGKTKLKQFLLLEDAIYYRKELETMEF